MEIKYHAGPNIRAKRSTKRIMFELTCALLVVYVFSFIHYCRMGPEYLRQIILIPVTAVGVCVLTEAVYARIHKKEVLHFLRNSFPWVTGLILALAVPVNTSLYALALSAFIAIFFGKLVYGGFGQNIFNPATVGRTVVLVGFARSRLLDVVASPTPTTVMGDNGWMLSPETMGTFISDFGGFKDLFIGNYFGAIGETSTLLILILGIALACLEVFDYTVPVFYLGTIFIGSTMVGLLRDLGLSFGLFNVLTGGVAFAAVFMFTDPVTNPNTRAGRIVFASIAAFFTVLIRYRTSLPEGVGYSILLVNVLTPAIEKYFDGKTTERMRKDTLTVIIVVSLCVIGIILLGMSLKAGDYESIMRIPEVLMKGRPL
ncbi:MAG: RnfABCDGE type electron transport complex subunit D [Erysipelotrichaceae bacterium]|nr:RnfABCDGE type electron transport complex subunit D [Erysipelotrichaceae bacterium]